MGACSQDGPQLHAEHVAILQRQSNASQAEERVALVLWIRQSPHLVGAEVEGAHHHRLAMHRLSDFAVGGVVGLFRRVIVPAEI